MRRIIVHSWVIGTLLGLLGLGQCLYAQTPTVNLSTHQPTSAPPTGTTFEWHSSLPVSASNIVTGPQASSVAPGMYYGVYNYGGSPVCYGSPAHLRVLTNTCAGTTVDLQSAVYNASVPASSTVTFHSSATISAATELASSSVTAGSTESTYYVAYKTYNSTTSAYCYSKVAPLVVILTPCCITPSVGGTATYAGGALCPTSNAGTITLSGQTGSVVKWQTSTNGGTTWTDISSTKTYYSFVNAVNGQQFRAVVNSGTGCFDANSTPITIGTNASACSSASCDKTTGTISFGSTPAVSGSQYATAMILTNAAGIIQYVSPLNSVSVTDVATGAYLVYQITYDNTLTPAPTLTVGTSLSGVNGACAVFSNQLALQVCPLGALPPVAMPDIANTNINTPVPGNVLTNDTDPQGGPLTASLLTPPTVGTVVVSPNGSYTYTPPTGFTGVTSFCYSITNTAGLSASACVTVNVNPVPSPAGNNPPVANNDATQTTMGTSVTINVAANDTDPDNATSVNGQLNTPTIVAQPSVGTASVNPDGTFKYTPPANFTGVMSFPYSICDKATTPLCATALVTVTILPTPPVGTTLAPVAVDDALLTYVNVPKTGMVATNDSDPQGLPLTFTTGQPVSGTVVMTPNGSYTYTPPAGFVGPTSFTYAVCNSAGKCDVATVSVDVLPGTLPPVATPDIANTNINTPVSGNVLTNDTDPQGLPLTASLLTPPTVGTVVVSPNGSYTYTPPTGFTGVASFCYSITNTAGLSSTACVTVNVDPLPSPTPGVNNPPIANNDNTQTTAGTSVTINVAANDTDPDSATSVNGQLNTPTIVAQPSVGTASVNPDGTFKYTPPANFTGVVTFPYSICDKATTPLCATALVTVNILPTPPVNTTLAPVAVDDALLTQVNTPKTGTVASNDTDPQGLPLTFTTGQPVSGTVVMSANGSYTYTPPAGFVGPTSFTYAVCNSAGKCDVATVSVLVQPTTALPPVATPDIANTNINTPVSGNVLTNDNDPQGGPLTASLLTPPTAGTVVVNPDGTYTYTPPTGFTGVTSFCYSITNTAGLSSTACVTVNVNPLPSPVNNNPPIANNDATQTTMGTSVTINVAVNDTDPDSATSVNGQLNTPTIVAQPSVGTASINPDGTFKYTPPANFTGVVSFPYSICDKATTPLCATALVTVTVLPTPPANTTLAPVAVDDALLTYVNVPKTGTVASNDSDPQGLPLTFTTGQPVSGTVVMTPNGSYTYTPPVGFVGPTSFTYSVCNSAGKCDVATVSVDVLPVNNPPVVIAEPLVTDKGKPATLCLPIFDADNTKGDTHTATICGQPVSGTASLSVNNVTHAVCLTYTPTSTFEGPTTVCVQVCDAAGLCTTVIIPITVIPTSPTAVTPAPPVVVVVPIVTPKDVPVTVCMKIVDPNPGDTHSVTVCSTPALGSATAVVDNVNHTVCVTYTPKSGSVGQDAVCLMVCDQGGLCTTVTVPVTIIDPTPPGPTPKPPVVTPTPIVTVIGKPVVVCTGIADNTGDTHTATICGPPASGTALVGIDNVTHLLCVTYTPGSTPANTYVCVTVCDQGGLCTNVILPITVLPGTLPPVATPDIANTNINTPVPGNVLTNDTDPQGLPLTASLLTPPTVGTVVVSPNGSYTYTPPTGFTGVTSFCYSITNTAGLSSTACVTVNVNPLPSPVNNNPPIANNDATQTTMGTSVTINVAANDTDPDSATSVNGQLNTPTIVAQPSVGTASINPDGTFKYTPPANFTGVVSFPYSICDKATTPLCATALVTVTILPTPPVGTTLAPVAVDDALLTYVNVPKTGTVAANDTDPQGLPLTFTTGQPTSGTVVMTPNGSYTYTPPVGFVGPTSFTYSVCNSAGKCDVATVSVDVLPVNNPPVIIGIPLVTDKGKPGTVCLPIADPDVTDSHTATLCGQPASGTATVSVNNTTHQVCLTYTPTSTFEGPTTVCVQVCDAAGNCTQTIVPITVIPVSQTAITPKPPVVVVVPIVTPKDVPAQVCMDVVDPNIGDTHSVSVCSNPALGMATATVNNTTHQVCVTYTPTSGSIGQDAICLNVCDASGLCTTVIVPITIVDPTPVVGPKSPVVTPTPIVTTPDKPVVVCTAITDTASDTHTASLCGPPSSGTAVVGVDNVTHALCVTYSPGSTPGNTFVCVQVCDQTGLCTNVILPITVLPTNLAPAVTPDVNTFVPGTSTKGNVLTNDKDPEGTPLTASVVGTPPAGFTMSPDGSYTYTAPVGTTAPVTIVYQACDSATPPVCATTTLTLTPVTTPNSLTNDAPVALNDATRTTADTPTTVNVLGNDKDPEGLSLSNPTIVSGPTHGTAVVNPDGTVSYSPAAGFTGVDKLTYQVCDTGSPVLCTTAVVTVTVDPTLPASVTNLPPVAIDDLLLTTKGTSATGTVASNDRDPNVGQTLTYTKLTNPANGTVVFNADGSYTYVPAPGFVGSDNFIYQVCDNGSPVLCTTATAYMTISDISSKPPVATPDIANTNINTPVSGNVLTNDVDPQSGPLTAILLTPPINGTVVINPDGTYTYTPPTGFTGVASFCYSITNTAGLSSSACVTVNVNPVPSPNPAVNNVPIANSDATQTTAGTSVTINVVANDTDPDSATSVNGQLNTPTIVAQPSVGTASVNPDGTFKYTPPANFTGVVTFPYSICDKATTPLCATALVTVTILPTPPANTTLAPVAVDDALLTYVNVPKTGTVASNDSDPQGLPLTFTSGQPVSGTVVMTPNGSYTYTPPAGFVGPTSFTYAVCNSAGKCDVATVSVLVQPTTALPPVATPDIANTNINTPVSGNVLTNDNDPQGGPLTASLLTPPTVGTVVVSPNGSYTYTPPTGFTGVASFCYSVTNSVGLSNSACVTVNIIPDPVPGSTNPPIANNDATQTIIGVPVTLAILANDNDPDSETTLAGQLDNPTIIGQPVVGTAVVNGNGTITYSPPAGFTGVVTFPYQVCDKGSSQPSCATALVTVTILPTPPANTTLAPVAVDDAILTTANKPAAGSVAINDTDPQGLPLTYTSGQPTSGTVVMSPNGSYTYTPAPGYVGPASFTYAVCNTAGKCDVATVSVLVQGSPLVVLRLKVMLQGALIGGTAGLMRDDLRSKKFLPLTEPYTTIGGDRFTHVNGGGGETMPANVTALNAGTGNAVVDWVFVELRDPSNLSLVVATRSAMVQRDGDVVLASDGVSPLSFSGLTGSSFYVSVKHRNHLGAMTATAIPLSTTGTVVDFTTMTAPQVWNKVVGVFNYEGWEQTTVSGKQALWAGDANHNGKVKYQGAANDLITIFSEVIGAQGGSTNPLYNYDAALGYYFGDVNMDGKVKYQGTTNDTSLIFTNVITNFQTSTQMNSAQLYNFDFMLEQLP